MKIGVLKSCQHVKNQLSKVIAQNRIGTVEWEQHISASYQNDYESIVQSLIVNNENWSA